MLKNTLCLLIASLSFQSALADARFDRIKQDHEWRLGYVSEDFPFNYEHEGKATGFGVELMEKIVQVINEQQKLPKMKTSLNKITLVNRFDSINNGTADIACGAHSNTIDRKKIVDFSKNYFLARSRMLTHADSTIGTYGDLKGKRIAVVRGSLPENVIRQRKSKFQYEELSPQEDYTHVISLIVSGNADAAIGDDTLLLGAAAKMAGNQTWKFVGPAVTLDRYACILPKNQPDLKKAVDDALVSLFNSGEFEALFKRWFQEPIPSENGMVTVNFEMSPAMSMLLTSPHDTAIGE
ncbi:MAG: amino acid ABC transporter substrate-binding protein [Cardiobacteriaceae bacterium]|nr:amino acid ABC transporter substrate-binding protein [Cardiobacteriaceae bacterium]